VTAGQTVTWTLQFYPYGSALPLDQHQTGRNVSSTAVFSLAGVLLFGFGFRRRLKRNSPALLLAVFAFAILPAISACGGGSGMTPGTYPYTINAGNEANPNEPLAQGVSTTISVTVP
jgi:peptidoglycan/LPS O-acetylase OafA/YrhL